MSATYDLTTEVGEIRLHTADTDIANPRLSDEEIAYALDRQGSLGGAVVWCLQFRIAQLADPNFRADWLQVDNASAAKTLRALLADKRQEFGIPALTASAKHTWRPDSGQTAAPTYPESEDE